MSMRVNSGAGGTSMGHGVFEKCTISDGQGIRLCWEKTRVVMLDQSLLLRRWSTGL